MQTANSCLKTSLSFIALAFSFLFLTGFSGFFGGDSIEEKIEKERAESKDVVHQKGDGLPFFDIKGLNPNWDPSGNIVKIPQISLQDQSGKVRDESLFQNKISIVAFVFTTCDGFCPFLLKHLQKTEKELESLKNQDNVQFVLFSVDPERDTPEQLRKYAELNKLSTSKWTFLTGDREKIYGLARDVFNSEAFKKEQPARRIVHSEHFYILDEKARLRSIINGTRIASPKEARKVVTELTNSATRIN